MSNPAMTESVTTIPSYMRLEGGDFSVMADGFLFAEGPVALADGSVVLVDVLAGDIVRIHADGSRAAVVHVGGGPNGAALGPDGEIYVCNNGGMSWQRDERTGERSVSIDAPKDYVGGWLDRVNLQTGAISRICETVGGERLSAPNDLVFDAEGGIWFTDLGKKQGRARGISGVFYLPAGATDAIQAIYGGVSFNGVGLSPDQSTLYCADTFTASLWAYPLEGPGRINRAAPPRLVARLPIAAEFDSLAVLASGDVCVGVLEHGGIAQISPSGDIRHYIFPDRYVTNICFGGDQGRDAYLTFSETGRLVHTIWPEPGLKLSC